MAANLVSIPLPENRTALELLIEAAIARLDELDGDPDLEPNLGSNAGAMWGGTYWPPEWVAERTAEVPDECEDVSEDEGAACEDEGAQDEREPSLGALERICQENWAHIGVVIDGEVDEADFDDDRHEGPNRPRPAWFDPAKADDKAAKCVAAVESLRALERQLGRPLSRLPHVVAGAIFKR